MCVYIICEKDRCCSGIFSETKIYKEKCGDCQGVCRGKRPHWIGTWIGIREDEWRLCMAEDSVKGFTKNDYEKIWIGREDDEIREAEVRYAGDVK